MTLPSAQTSMFNKVSKLVENLLGYIQSGSVLDLGSGAGGNSVFLAQHGFSVEAIDISPEAIDELNRRTAEVGVSVRTSVGNIASMKWGRSYDVIICTFALHFLHTRDALDTIRAMQTHTSPGGFNVVAVFTKEGDLIKNDPNTERFLASGHEQFRNLYAGWNLHTLSEKETRLRKKREDGTPLTNMFVGLIAQKVDSEGGR